MILVLNAGGNIGKELVRELTKRGADFTAAYRSADKVAASQAEGVKAVAADFSKPDTLHAALAGVEKLFFVSPPIPNLEELEANIVTAAKQAGVTHLVKMSVWGAEGAKTIFAIPHRAVEERIIASGLPYTFLRPTGFMQNMLANAGSIKGHGMFTTPVGEARVAEIDFRDIAKVAAVALTEDGHIGKAYDLSGVEAMTMTERALILSELLGRKISAVIPSDAEWKAMMLGYGVPEWQVEGILDLARYYKEGNSERVSPAVQEVTGSLPITYRQFVEDYLTAFKA